MCMTKYIVKKLNNKYFVGRVGGTSFGSDEFVLPLGRKYEYKSKTAAEKQAKRLNK